MMEINYFICNDSILVFTIQRNNFQNYTLKLQCFYLFCIIYNKKMHHYAKYSKRREGVTRALKGIGILRITAENDKIGFRMLLSGVKDGNS